MHTGWESKPFDESNCMAMPGRGPVFLPKLTGAEISWFALYVQVNHEKEVAKRLEQKSIASFLPLMECWSKRKDRRKRISIPVFPGYVFVHAVLDNYTNVHVLRTPGALSMVKNSEGPLPIPDHQIDSLKIVLGSQEPVSIHPYLKEGDWVHVVRGLLTGCTGILLRRDSKKGRLAVSIDIVQKAVSVELNMEDVEPTPNPLVCRAAFM